MKKSNLIFIFLAILISSIGIISILKPGFFLTDDGNSMVIRFSAFYEALRSGQFPVRFLSRLNFGYGYPVSDFLYPLFMYIGIPIHVLGISFVNTIKVIFLLSFLSGTIFTFLWLRKLFDEKSAFLGSVVYSLFPYHLLDIYKRGSIGEVLALGIVPFILWQIERRSFVWGSVGIFFLILSHNTLAVLFLIFIALYAILDIYVSKNRNLKSYYGFIAVIGLGLSSFFSIPAVFDLQYTVFSKTQVSDWSKYFSDFTQIGFSTLIIFLTFIFLVGIKKIDIKKHRLTLLMFAVGAVSIFLSTSVSSNLWKILPSSFVQFPFRFLSVAILATAFLSGSLISQFKNKLQIGVLIVFLVLVFFSSKNFLTPNISQNYPDSFYSTNQDSTTVKNEYMPRWVEQVPNKMASQVAEVLSGESKLKNLVSKGTNIKFDLDSKGKSLIQISKIYFPGWEVYIDGGKTNIFYNNRYGIIQFEVGKGNHIIEAKFHETNVRLLSDVISIVSLFLLIFVSKKYAKFS